MPRSKISEYSATANSNTDVASINIDEGCAPSGINNAIRAVMGHLKDFQTGSAGDPLTVGGALTTSSTVTHNGGTANGVAYLNASKVLTTGSALTFDGTNFVNNTGYVRAGNNTFAGYLSAWGGGSGATIDILPNAVSGANGVVYNTSFISGGAGPHIFQIGGSEQMRLTSTGLGIGTSSPLARADIVQATSDTANGLNLRGYTTGVDGGRTFNINTISSDANNWANLNFKAQQFTFSLQGTEKMRLDAAGNLGLGVTANANTKFDTNGPIRAGGYTVATLPTGVVGARAYVTDAMAAVFMAVPTGGGSVKTPVFYNGTNWVCG